MYGLRRFGIILGLSTIQGILAKLGNPQETFRSIHVAGTNGKGSVASALATIFQLAGYKVGLYTSPHLVHFNERIRVNGETISNDRVVATHEAVQSVHQGDREPTFFEFSTAMAFYEFGHQSVDWAIIETGMGGRLDATNVITPDLSIITNISLEHQAYLGRTIAQIAGEKAGIIKPGVPVVTGITQQSAEAVVLEQADRKQAPVYRLGKEFRIHRNSGTETFTYYGVEGSVYPEMRTGLPGRHQLANAAQTVAACELLDLKKTARLPLAVIRKGLLENRWPGRMEILSKAPTVLLDGAHNKAAVRLLAQFLSKQFAGRHITLVTGILDDKAYPEMLACLLPLCARAILTQPKIDRSLPAETLRKVAETIIPNVTVIPDAPSALQYAVRTSAPDDVVCVAGSLYLVGEIKEAIEVGAIVL